MKPRNCQRRKVLITFPWRSWTFTGKSHHRSDTGFDQPLRGPAINTAGKGRPRLHVLVLMSGFNLTWFLCPVPLITNVCIVPSPIQMLPKQIIMERRLPRPAQLAPGNLAVVPWGERNERDWRMAATFTEKLGLGMFSWLRRRDTIQLTIQPRNTKRLLCIARG